MDVEKFITRYPRLFHMAEADSWPSIRRHGLLSTGEVARRTTFSQGAKLALRREHRPEKLPVDVPGIGVILLRDQKPMEATRLRQALIDGTTPQEWYELINDRVFFWAREERLFRLLKARDYRSFEHDVLTVDTESLIATHRPQVRLCHMNSGNTFPIPHHRGRDAFCRIEDYPVRRTGTPVREVVEVTVQHHVLDIADHVVAVRRMRGAQVVRALPIK